MAIDYSEINQNIFHPVCVSLAPQLCATLGTTGVCAFDNLSELGPVCTSLTWLQSNLSSPSDLPTTSELDVIPINCAQVQKKNCGCMLMPPTLVQPTSVLSCAGPWKALNWHILLSSTLASGWWSTSTARLSGWLNSLHVISPASKCFTVTHCSQRMHRRCRLKWCDAIILGWRINSSSSRRSLLILFTSDMTTPQLLQISWYCTFLRRTDGLTAACRTIKMFSSFFFSTGRFLLVDVSVPSNSGLFCVCLEWSNFRLISDT